MKRRYDRLDATMCRRIALQEVLDSGPISVCELWRKLVRVFPETRLDTLCSGLCKRGSGLAVIEGVVDTCPQGLSPLARHEAVKKAKRYGRRKAHARS